MSRRELLVFVSAAMALMAVGIDTMLPAFDDMRASFGLEPGSTAIGQTITTYLIGAAVAQLVWGPLSDRHGRRPVLYAGLVVYIVGAAASALAPSLGSLLVARFVWGLGAGAPRVVATAIVRDSTEGEAMARAMSKVMAVFILVPIVAPSLGAVVVAFASWRVIFWGAVAAAVLIGAWATRLPETLAPENVRPLGRRELVDAGRRVVRTPITLRTTIAAVALQAAMTLYLTMSEPIIGDVYDRGAWFPFVFGLIAVGLAVASLANGRIVARLGLGPAIRAQAVGMATFAALLVGVTVIFDQPGFVVFHVVVGATLMSFMMLNPNLMAAGMIPMGDMAGTASSVTSAARIGVGSALAGLIVASGDVSLSRFAIGMAVFIGVSALLAWRSPVEAAERDAPTRSPGRV